MRAVIRFGRYSIRFGIRFGGEVTGWWSWGKGSAGEGMRYVRYVRYDVYVVRMSPERRALVWYVYV